MLLSIKNIFRNITILHILLTIILFIISLISIEKMTAFEKIKTLQTQKQLMKTIYTLDREDLELSQIQFRGKSVQLVNEESTLRSLFALDVMSAVILDNKVDYTNDLNRLKKALLAFNASATQWLNEENKNYKASHQALQEKMLMANGLIDRIIEKNVDYEYERFLVQATLIFTVTLLLLLITLWYSRRLKAVYKDIQSLYVIEHDSNEYEILTEEVKQISKRMGRKASSTENPAMIDPVTGINNYKGLVYSYGNKKGQNQSHYTALCLIQIDNFKALDKKYPKEVTQAILKKVSFILSLYEQHTDTIGRVEYDQFVFVLSRSNKDAALNDCEQIRRTIEESKFKVPKGDSLSVTISGGFILKASNRSLDETIEQARDILQVAKDHGGNKVAQLRDQAERF